MATIKKLSSGRYQAQTCIKGVRRAKTFTRQVDAKRWATQLELDAESGLSEGARLPLSHYILQHRDLIQKKHKHSRHESAVLSFLLEDPIADIPACSVTSEDIKDWIERRRTIPSRRTGRIVEESTIARQLQIISAMFSNMVDQQVCKENPCHGVDRPKENPPRERVATEEEIERIKFVAGWEEGAVPYEKIQRVAAAFVLACCTGMRSGEMMRIERSWIKGRVLRIPAEAAKTRTAREIALNDRAMAVINCVLGLGCAPTIWDLSDGSRDALWRKIRDKAGLQEVRDSEGRLIKQGLTFHDGRATFCTWAASPGADGAPRLDVMSLARQTGHKNLKMLMRYYRPSVESFVDRLNK